MNWQHKQYPQHNFDEKDYAITHGSKFKNVSDVILQGKPSKILDIGAGTGTVYSFLNSLDGYEIHALEIVPEFVETLSERGIHAHIFDLGRGEKFPFEDETFDLVICDSMLEHTLKPKYMIEESRRVLKKEGKFILVVPNAVSIRRRWDQLRGRNIFYPLIDNLFTRDYLQRCSIFYSQADIEKYIGSGLFRIDTISFINETHHDTNSPVLKIFRLISKMIPYLKDVIIMTGSKN